MLTPSSPILSSPAPESTTATIFTGLILASIIFWFITSGKLKRNPAAGATIILIIIVAFITFIFVNPSNLGRIIRSETTLSEVINANKDIQTVGGTSVTLEVEPSIDPHTGKEITITPEAMDAAKNILENRLNAKGIINASLYINDNQIKIHLPNFSPEEAESTITPLITTAQLSIHQVHRNSRNLADAVAAGKEIIPGHIALKHQETDHHTKEKYITNILIKRRKEITSNSVKAAYIDPRDYTTIRIELTQEGGEKMKAFTKTLTPRVDMIATVLNGKVINYATLNATFLSRHFVITGLNSKQEATDLIKALQNPLQNPLKIINTTHIKPTK